MNRVLQPIRIEQGYDPNLAIVNEISYLRIRVVIFKKVFTEKKWNFHRNPLPGVMAADKQDFSLVFVDGDIIAYDEGVYVPALQTFSDNGHSGDLRICLFKSN